MDSLSPETAEQAGSAWHLGPETLAGHFLGLAAGAHASQADGREGSPPPTLPIPGEAGLHWAGRLEVGRGLTGVRRAACLCGKGGGVDKLRVLGYTSPLPPVPSPSRQGPHLSEQPDFAVGGAALCPHAWGVGAS